MTNIESASSFDELAKILRHPTTATEPVVLTKDGAAFAAIVPVAGPAVPDAETLATWRSPAFQQILARSRADTDAGREQPLDDVAGSLASAHPGAAARRLGASTRPCARRAAGWSRTAWSSPYASADGPRAAHAIAWWTSWAYCGSASVRRSWPGAT